RVTCSSSTGYTARATLTVSNDESPYFTAHLFLTRLRYQRPAALLGPRNGITSKVKPSSTAPAPPLAPLSLTGTTHG
ncbi:hypothetical protein T11_3598, partial [Trichinella zimbabwensis]